VNLIKRAATAAAVALLAAGAAQAQTAATGFYINAQAGMSRHAIDCEGAARCDTSGTGLRVAAGYRFTPLLGAEIGYVDYGKTKASGPSGFNSVDVEFAVKASGATLVLFAPVAPQLEMQARLGVAQVRAKLRGRVDGSPWFDAGSENKTAPWLGLGLTYAFTPNLAASLLWEGTRAEFDGERDRVSAFTLGATFRF
jgi:OmpA-OmpF porin, OOP family